MLARAAPLTTHARHRSYLNVYTHPGLSNVPILGTLGNRARPPPRRARVLRHLTCPLAWRMQTTTASSARRPRRLRSRTRPWTRPAAGAARARCDHARRASTPCTARSVVDASAPRRYIPAHNYQRYFTSASGAVTLQVVSVDSTPLNDRYLYSGASGGGFATDASGADTVPNNNAGNAVLNPGVTAANGFVRIACPVAVARNVSH